MLSSRKSFVAFGTFKAGAMPVLSKGSNSLSYGNKQVSSKPHRTPTEIHFLFAIWALRHTVLEQEVKGTVKPMEQT